MGLGNNLLDAADNAVKILDDHKDVILLGAGLTAGLGTVIFASRATLKADDILKTHKANAKRIKEAADLLPQYKSSTTYKQDVILNCVNTGVQMTKMYAPAIVLGATATACFIGEHCVMQQKVTNLEKTVASLSAAYIAVDNAFKAYRKRVVAKYGAEEDRNLRYGIEKEKVEVTDLSTGKKKKEEVEFLNDIQPSDYAKFFDGTSDQFIWQDPMKYKPDWDRNISFLNMQENSANGRLRAQGYLFLNDVYEMLGIPKTQAGQVVGWIYDPDIVHKVEFGIFNPINHRTINGYEEECLLLDFNVDGIIIDKIKLGVK